jgi:endo-1,4-beta-D-glucanase Y
MHKKILVMGCVALLLLTACGKQNGEQDSTSSTSSTKQVSKRDNLRKTAVETNTGNAKLPSITADSAGKALGSWTANYVSVDSANKTAFVKTNDNQGAVTTFSEATGYAMLLSVAAKQRGQDNGIMFERFYNYYKQHESATASPLMAWRQTERNGQMTSDSSEQNDATDADLDIAYALIQQGKLTGNQQYTKSARAIINALKTQCFNVHTYMPKLGNWATNATNQHYVRTSDLIPYYYQAFAKLTGDSFWTKASAQAYKVLQLAANAKTGLVPDFVVVTGDAKNVRVADIAAGTVEGVSDPTYAYNACRVPWRLANDYVATNNQIDRRILTKIVTFMQSQSKVYAGYTVDGQATQAYTDPAFTNPLWFAAKVLGNESAAGKFGVGTNGKYFADTLSVLMQTPIHNVK